MNLRASVVFLTFLCGNALAQSSGFRLGVDYTEWLGSNVRQTGTDSSGALYFLSSAATSTVTKLSADGKTMLWQNQLGFLAATMAVDPTGGVYVAEVKDPPPGVFGVPQSVSIAKVNPSATGLAWSVSPGFSLRSGFSPFIAADSNGRAYVAGFNDASGATSVVRLTAAGNGIDYATSVTGIVSSIAVDQSGAAFITGVTAGGGSIFLARVAPDGSAGFYSSVSQRTGGATVVPGTDGNAVVYSSGMLYRFDSTGAVTFSKQSPRYPGVLG